MKDAEFGIWVIGLLMFVGGLSIIYLNTHSEDVPTLKGEPIPAVEEIEIQEEEPEPAEEKHIILSDEDMMAQVVMAESGNQDMLGKVAVATTILNRCDYFGMTVESVITEPNQYSYPYYGTVSEDCYRAVEIAQQNRDLFPSNMLYFRTFKYHSFGTPYEQIGDHYFSLKED